MSANYNIEPVEGGGRVYTKPKTEILPLAGEAFEYLTKSRGLGKDTLAAYRVGLSRAGEIVIPFFDEQDKLVLVKFRHPAGKLLKRKRRNGDELVEYEAKTAIEPGGKPVLLGSHLCDPREGALVICFGDYDAMSVSQDGVPNCVSLPFGDKGFGFIEQQWNFLEAFSEIVIYPDADVYPNPDAELQAQKKLEQLIGRLGKHRTRIVREADRFGTKDANDLLLKKGSGANRTAVNCAEWSPDSIVAVADYIDDEQEEGTPIGISAFDRATGGIVEDQVVIFSGDNGAGKTTEALNITASFVNEGLPVFWWSGEQTVKKIRYWFERIVAGPGNLRRVVNERTGFEYFYPLDDVKQAIRRWYRHFLFQYTETNIDAEKFFAAAEIAVRRYDCRLIVIDNLMAFTGGEGDGYYQAQGDFAQSCKQFAALWRVPVLLICHNRKEDENSGKRAKLPTKNSIEGSKKITNWADIVVQMYRVPEIYKQDFGNADSVMILCKTRESGLTQDIALTFDHESNRFAQRSEEYEINRRYDWDVRTI